MVLVFGICKSGWEGCYVGVCCGKVWLLGGHLVWFVWLLWGVSRRVCVVSAGV